MTLRVKNKITVFDVKYAENGKSYDVGPTEHDFRSHTQHQPGPFAKIFSLLVILDFPSLIKSLLSRACFYHIRDLRRIRLVPDFDTSHAIHFCLLQT